MAHDATKLADGTLALAELQSTVQQQEGVFGPLKSLGKSDDGKNTKMVFTIGATPANRAILEAHSGAGAPAKPGYVTICSGTCIVASAAQAVAAYRKS